MSKTKYVVMTGVYGTVAVLAVIATVYFAVQLRFFLALIMALIVYVALDNFFCGSHAKKCGYEVAGHYVIPPFLRGK